MDHAHTTDVNPAELARAEAGWVNFTGYAMKGVIVVIALLVFMAVTLL